MNHVRMKVAAIHLRMCRTLPTEMRITVKRIEVLAALDKCSYNRWKGVAVWISPIQSNVRLGNTECKLVGSP